MDNKLFDDKRIAEGYAKDRPWLHPLVMEQIKNDCCIKEKFKNGLDVGCGAGLSTKALKLICEKVTGTDISEEMITVCKRLYTEPDYRFYTAKAEETKIPEKQYDIVTAAGVINWVDREKFLQNMSQVMVKDGYLIIYDFWISDKMVENEEYTKWWHKIYLPAFPKPQRKEDIWSQKDMFPGFSMKKQITYQMQYEFDKEAFIRFMMIQSNVNTQIESGHRTVEEVQSFMEQTLTPVFHGERKTLIFEGYNWYITRS